jgi:antitoxin ParD1/3/4
MNISLTPHQESLIQSKLQTGKYNSAEEAMQIALQLLDEYDHTEQNGLKMCERKLTWRSLL